MTPEELRRRTAEYASTVSRLVRPLLKDPIAKDAATQLARAAASTAANYRAACIARSHAEFRSKIGLTLEEADESVFWMEFLRDAGLSDRMDFEPLVSEGRELVRILGASKRTSRLRAATRVTPKRHLGRE